MICPNCGYDADDKAAVCLGCGMNLERTKKSDKKKVGAGWWWLGFFIPVAGILIWAICRDEEPRKAKRAGIGAICGIITGVLLYLLITLLPLLLLLLETPIYDVPIYDV